MFLNNTNIIKENSRGISSLSIADELFRSRVIFFTDEVNPASCCNLTQQLIQLESESSDPITIIINSPGGDVLSGMGCYDIMTSLRSPVRTVISGLGASMGAILFLAGSERIMCKHSQLMLHDPSWHRANMAGMKPLAIQEQLQDLLNTRNMLGEIIAERTGHTTEEVFELTKKDCYMTAEEALEYGACTAIANFTVGTPGSLIIKTTDN